MHPRARSRTSPLLDVDRAPRSSSRCACTEPSPRRSAPPRPDPDAKPDSPPQSPLRRARSDDSRGDGCELPTAHRPAVAPSSFGVGIPFAPSSCRDPERPTLTGRFPGTLRVAPGRRRHDLAHRHAARSIATWRASRRCLPPGRPRRWTHRRSRRGATRSRRPAGPATRATRWTSRSARRPPARSTGGSPCRRTPPTGDGSAPSAGPTGRSCCDGGDPATTVYFSTSNGRTYANEDVFGSAPLPYLRPVTERDDGASPTSRWRVRLPFGDLTAFLRAAGDGPDGRSARATTSDGIAHPPRGRHDPLARRRGPPRCREHLGTRASVPGDYPTEERGSHSPLTIPSRWLQVSATDARRRRHGAGVGTRRRHGPVGGLREGPPGMVRRRDPRLLLRRPPAREPSRTGPDPRPGRERSHRAPDQAPDTGASMDGEPLERRPRRDHGRRPPERAG